MRTWESMVMSRQLRHSFFNWSLSAVLAAATLGIFATTVTPTFAQTGRPGVTTTVTGTRVTVAELLQQGKATLPPTTTANGVGEPSIIFHPSIVPSQAASGAQSNVSAEPHSAGLQPMSPQAITDTIVGPSVQDTGLMWDPPDTMGAIGPSQFGFTVSGLFSFVSKTAPHNPIFQQFDGTFWGNTALNLVTDPKVRYDRTLGVWYISEIDTGNGNNDILFAVSTGPDISTASWTKFRIPATGGIGSGAGKDEDCFVHFDTVGVDQNAVYIGGDVTNNQQAHGGPLPCDQGTPGTFQHTNLYVISKTGITGPNLTITSFYDLSEGGIFSAPFTPEPADSFDNLSTGYVIGPDMAEESSGVVSHLDVLPVLNPGTSPTLGTVTQITIPQEHLALRNVKGTGPLTPNNIVSADPARGMDDLDDRMLSATIRNGQLWTAHNVAVDVNGNSNAALSNLDRDGERWYEININSMTITQSGTVSDTTTPLGGGPLNYWMGAIMASGQGHAAMGLNYANASTTLQGVAVGRLASDALNTMRGFTSFVSSQGFAYDDKTVNGQFAQNTYNRWGDFSY